MTKVKSYGSVYTEACKTKIKRKSTFEKLSNFFKHSEINGNSKSAPYKIRKNSIFFICYVLFYIGFLITGALTFSTLESPYEFQKIQEFERIKENFFQDYPDVNVSRLEELIASVADVAIRGPTILSNSTYESNWNFARSIFFSSTIVTTIGYGDMAPHTRSGKIFFLIFAMVGIPLTLVLITAFVERLLIPATWFLRKLNDVMGQKPPFHVRLLHLAVIVFLLVFVFMVLPAIAFTCMEHDWQFLDSFYYCFISLTTIGLGDYIPGDDSFATPYDRAVYKIAATIYLFTGVTFMMLTLTVFYNVPQLNIGLFFRSYEENCHDDTKSLTSTTSLHICSQYQLEGADLYKAFQNDVTETITISNEEPE